MGCTYERKRLAGTDCVGCTCDRKQFRRIIVFFSFTVCIYVFERSPVTRSHFAERACQEDISPTVSGSCGKEHPITHTHLVTVPDAIAERGLKPFV